MTTRYKIVVVTPRGEAHETEASGLYAEQMIYGKYAEIKDSTNFAYLALFEGKTTDKTSVNWVMAMDNIAPDRKEP